MPQVGFEPMIRVFERAKTVHALDHTATVIGSISSTGLNLELFFLLFDKVLQILLITTATNRNFIRGKNEEPILLHS
jgi:hypothetical protein